MNTAIYTLSGASAGIGFAIPVDTLKYEVSTLIRDGRIVRPVIGISYLATSQAKIFGIQSGVLVLSVPPSSNAAKAGLRGTFRDASGVLSIGDIIVGVDEFKVESETDLFEALENHRVGDIVAVSILRPINGDDSSTINTRERNAGSNSDRQTIVTMKIPVVLSSRSTDER
jgi:S1-C subfamily serine protease